MYYEHLGKRIGSSKKKATWLFGWRGEEKVHSVEYVHSLITGKRILIEDGRVVTTNTSVLSFEFSHGWGSNGHIFRVEATNGISSSASFKFSIDGESYDTFPTREAQQEEDEKLLNSAILASLNRSTGGGGSSSSNNVNSNSINKNNSSLNGSNGHIKSDLGNGKSRSGEFTSDSPAVTSAGGAKSMKADTAVALSSSFSSNAQSSNGSLVKSNVSGESDRDINHGVRTDDAKIEKFRRQKQSEFEALEVHRSNSNVNTNFDNDVVNGKKELLVITTNETDVLSDSNEGDVDFYTPKQQLQQQHFNILTKDLPPSRF